MKLLGGIEEGTAVQKIVYGIIGLGLILAVWIALTAGEQPLVTSGILPSPWRVITSFSDLLNDNELLRNTGISIGLNLAGYIEAILITIPVGFIVGLMKFPRFAFMKQIEGFRYVPLTAVTGLFIVWFGIDTDMKVHFLAFGILIYLLPVMVQRIDEVGDVYLKTAHTLGATDWQIVKSVYFPSVLSRLSDDLRVLTAISWTYIIVAEGINSSQGGLGALIYNVGQRQGRMDKLFALLILIILIGIIQDRIFVWLDKELFPYKYQAKEAIKSSKLESKGLIRVIWEYAMMALGWIVLGLYGLLMLCECVPVLGQFKPLSYLFGDTVWIIHIIVIAVLLLKTYTWYQKRQEQTLLNQLTSKPAGK